MKINDIVKLTNIGVGKIEKVYDDLIVINICGTQYFRYFDNMKDVEESNTKEYKEYIKYMIKQLTEQSKAKRKEASEYNKETDGYATKRKGKVTVINGSIYGFAENSISQYHSSLLSDAKKAREIKDKLKKELEYLKIIGA